MPVLGSAPHDFCSCSASRQVYTLMALRRRRHRQLSQEGLSSILLSPHVMLRSAPSSSTSLSHRRVRSMLSKRFPLSLDALCLF